MKFDYPDDSIALHTDAYQLTMMQTYWQKGIANRHVVFEAFFRKMPFGNGYAVFAGLSHIIRYLNALHFSDSDIEYLKSTQQFDPEFIEYLRGFRFKGTLRSAVEGDLVYSHEPIIQVEGTLLECQLVETALLNIINYQIMIATKASRIKSIVGDQPVMEFGSRRAQEFDAAIWGTRAAYIGGFDATSNLRAGKLFGIRYLVRMLTRSCRHTAMIMMLLRPTLRPIMTVFFWLIPLIRLKAEFPMQSKSLMSLGMPLISKASGLILAIWPTSPKKYGRCWMKPAIPTPRSLLPIIWMNERLWICSGRVPRSTFGESAPS